MNAIEQALSRASDKISVEYDSALEFIVSRVRQLQSEILGYYGRYATDDDTDYNKHRLQRETREAVAKIEREIIDLWREILERLMRRFNAILVDEVNSALPIGIKVKEDDEFFFPISQGEEWIRVGILAFISAVRSGFIRGGDYQAVSGMINRESKKLQVGLVRAIRQSMTLAELEKKNAVVDSLQDALLDYSDGVTDDITVSRNGLTVTLKPGELDIDPDKFKQTDEMPDLSDGEPILLYRRTQGNSRSGICAQCAPYIGMLTDGSGTDGVPKAPLHVHCVCHDTPVMFDYLSKDNEIKPFDWLKTLTERELASVIGKSRAVLVKTGKLKLSDLYGSDGRLKPLG